MISAIRDLGEWLQREEAKEPLDVLIQPINEDNYPHVIIIAVDNEDWTIEVEECQTSTSTRYLYRRGSPRGINFSPTSMVTDIEKTFDIKVMGWFKKVLKNKKKYSSDVLAVIERVNRVINEHQEAILNEVKNKIENLDGGVVITVKVDNCYLKENPAFVSIFEDMVGEKDAKYSSSHQQCSVCGSKSDKILAGTSAFKFYTIDKPGFITGNFDADQSWRNFPVCTNCNLLLQEGKRFIEEHLRFRFYGISYLLIPQLLFGGEYLQEDIVEILKQGNKHKSLQETSVRDTIAEEDDILGYLQEENDHLLLNLLFVQKVQAAERILMLIEDVVPSRLRQIFEAKQKVEQRFPTKEDAFKHRAYHFGRIRKFFNKSDNEKRNSDLDKYFLEITAAVFRGQELNIGFLTNFFMKEIRRNLNDESGSYIGLVTDALMNILFFEELEILKKGEAMPVESSRFEAVFEKYGPHLDRPEKRGLFLLGALTQALLRKQYNERGSQPFLKQLKGLKMHEKDFLGLLPKVQDKLQQYDAYDSGKRVLAEEISNLLLSSHPGWKLSVDEMNFYFVSGMNLVDKVNEILYQGQSANGKEE